jgi:hypothetical protein
MFRMCRFVQMRDAEPEFVTIVLLSITTRNTAEIASHLSEVKE